MAGQNDFLIFDENNENILTQELYEGDDDRLDGFKRGLARSNVNNKVLRQTSMMASAIGEYIKENNNVASDSNLEQLKNAFKNSVVSPNLNQTITGSMTFAETITGNITNADSALKDGNGDVISSTYLKTSDLDSIYSRTSLSNLSDAGNARLHALKGYSDEGELLTDAEGLADVVKYAHSTFDRSKFTVVGSPNITDDGIASGFSNDNYIALTGSKDFDYSKPFIIKMTCAFATTEAQTFMLQDSSGTNGFRTTNSNNTTIAPELWIAGSQKGRLTNFVFNSNVLYDFIFTFDGVDKYKCFYKEHTASTFTEGLTVTTSSTLTLATDFYLFKRTGYSGTVDLKQLSIIINGIPVFSGNKTGIDTIFDNISVAKTGNPTITTDGILTSSDMSNFLRFGVNSLPSSWEIEGVVTTPTLPTTANNTILYVKRAGNANAKIVIRIDNDKSFFVIGYYKTDGTYKNTSYNVLQYTKYSFKVEVVGSDIKVYIDNTLVVSENDFNTSENIDTISIGSQGGYNVWTGKLDLNAFKYYANGNLVYQPCLKIPYTESKTGSKIVDSIYRDRVNDMAEQFGYANYYTLSDTDFTLPQVELYGLIERKLQTPDYANGITITSSPYTAPDNGIIAVSIVMMIATGSVTVKINNVVVATDVSSGTYAPNIQGEYLVKKGDVLTFESVGTIGTKTITFFPYMVLN
jgi:hypothetical protein